MTFLLQSIERILSALPLPAALRLGRGLGGLLGSVIRYHRADAEDALRRAFPDADARWVRETARRCYAHLGMNLVESLRLRRAGRAYVADRVAWSGIETLRRALEGGRGACLLTAHTGNWELACATAPVFGLPLTIVVKPIKGRALDAHVAAVRQAFGLQTLPSRGSYRDCRRTLRDNGLLGFVLDQNMTRDEGVFVDFLGRPACTTAGLAHLAAVARAPVVPVFAERLDGGRHVIHVLPALEPPADTEPETLRAATQVYTRAIEDFIRAHPDQWIWLHRRWRTRPPA